MAFENFLRSVPQQTTHQSTSAFGGTSTGTSPPPQTGGRVSRGSDLVSEAAEAVEKAKPIRTVPRWVATTRALWQREEVQNTAAASRLGSFSLAGTEVLCLIAGITVHREEHFPALASGKAAHSQVYNTASAHFRHALCSTPSNQSLHPDGAGDAAISVWVCLFARGKVKCGGRRLRLRRVGFSFFSASGCQHLTLAGL